MVNHVLVYGTLRRDERASYMMDGCKFLNVVSVPGQMFSLGAFPGIKLVRGDDRFVAELYELDDDPATLAGLDNYEGYHKLHPKASLYLRKVVTVQGIDAYVYEYNGNPNPQARIYGGDWKQRNG